MLQQEIIKAFKAKNYKKGSYIKYEMQSTTKTGNGDVIVKHTKAVGRFMLEYGKLKSVREKNLLKPSTSKGWGTMVTDCEYQNLFKTHNGKTFIYVYTSQNKRHKAKSTYTLNGEPVTKEYLLENNLIESNSYEIKYVFTPTIDKIVSIG